MQSKFSNNKKMSRSIGRYIYSKFKSLTHYITYEWVITSRSCQKNASL